MPTSPTPWDDSTEFDALCAGVGEWEPLPSMPRVSPEAPEDEDETALDGLILAGLVSPYG